jgi:hypothetical protein
MKAFDDQIRKALQKNMLRIDDESFTERIIKDHLSGKVVIQSKPFINFKSLVIGISLVIVSIGLIWFIGNTNLKFGTTVLNELHGLIIFSISILFLIFKWLEELFLSKTSFTNNL